MNKHKIYFLVAFLAVGSTAIALEIFPVECVIPSNEINTPKITPKSAGYWDLTGSPILIDGNWSDTQLAYPWCTGGGNINNPYRIENVTIDGRQKSSCLTIKNTNEYFVIQNCTFFNTTTDWTTFEHAGVWLENADNGKILNCYFTQSNYSGISLGFCSNINISNNIIEQYQHVGIVVWDCDHLYLNENNLSYGHHGIFTTKMYDSEITHNRIINMSGYGATVNDELFNALDNNNYVAYNTFINIIEDVIGVSDGNKNTFFRNDIIGGGQVFIRGYRNKIYNNTFLEPGDGIYTDRSDNEFIGNHIEAREGRNSAYDQYGTNYWYNNYFSDYAGMDANDDGIGDIPHFISGGTANDSAPHWWDAPVLSISSPSNITYEHNPSFAISVDEGIEDAMWYTLNHGITNHTLPGLTGDINETEWFGTPDGPIDISFYVNDSLGYVGMATVQVIKELSAPDITFVNPAINQECNATPPSFTITITDLSTITGRWYTIDGGLYTYNFTGLTAIINSETWANASEGSITLTIYVMDDLGQIGSESRTIIKSLPEETEGIAGYDIFIVIGAISIISLLAIKKKRKIRS